MGIEPFLITSAIVGVVAQRLVRRICTSCAVPYEPTLSELTIFRKLGGRDKDVWLRGKGCQNCSGTGYFDRVGVYEVLAITDEIRQCVVDGNPPQGRAGARDLTRPAHAPDRGDPHGRGRRDHDGRSREARRRG